MYNTTQTYTHTTAPCVTLHSRGETRARASTGAGRSTRTTSDVSRFRTAAREQPTPNLPPEEHSNIPRRRFPSHPVWREPAGPAPNGQDSGRRKQRGEHSRPPPLVLRSPRRAIRPRAPPVRPAQSGWSEARGVKVERGPRRVRVERGPRAGVSPRRCALAQGGALAGCGTPAARRAGARAGRRGPLVEAT